MADQDELAKALAQRTNRHAFDVESALDAHVEWRRRLQDAVGRGFCELDSDEIGRDDQCALGRWLHSLPPERGVEAWCDEVIELHARFHREAGVVVHYLEAGRIDSARDAMASDSEFARAFEELAGLLQAWRDAA